MAPVPPVPHGCFSCKYGLIWLLFISLSCCGRHEYQDPFYNHKTQWKLTSFILSTCIIRLTWLADLPSSFPMHQKENIPFMTNSWCEYLKGPKMETRVVIGDSNDGDEFPTERKGWERGLLCLRSSTQGYRRRQRQWLARVILYEVFPPESTMILAWLYENPLLVIYFGILISSWPFYVIHYPHKQDIARQDTSLRPCDPNTCMLLLVN